MTALQFVILVAVLAGDLLLVGAGLRGLARPGSLRATLRQHQLLPPPFRGVLVVRMFQTATTAIGAFGVVANLLAVPAIAGPANAGTAAVYAAFIAYLGVLWRRRGAVPCGCLNGYEKVGPVSIGRDVVVFIAALVLAIKPVDLPPGPRWLALAVAACVAALAVAAGAARPAATTAAPPRA